MTMKKKRIALLDCTLRDGGYINDWNFSRECYDSISLELQRAGVDFIELGLIGEHNSEEFKTKFRNLDEIPVPEKVGGANTKFTVMMTGAEYQKLVIKECKHERIATIRYAFFKVDYRAAVENMRELVEKGYCVFAQTMATFEYSDEELRALISAINEIGIYAFYIVDSFGTMYPDDIEHLYDIVDKYLNKDIYFGLHAHNNLQMANANVIKFIELAKDRNIIVDGSIYGMGRGAGNASTELIMHFLNRKERIYDENLVWELYGKYISKTKEEYDWGYLPAQFLVSAYHTNPAYIWYLSTLGIVEFNQIQEILKQIPDDKRYTLNKDVINGIIGS